MKNQLSKKERLEAILEKCCEGVKTRFAEKMNVDINTFMMRYSRGTWYDACALAEAFPDINTEWLVNGVGEMMKDGSDAVETATD